LFYFGDTETEETAEFEEEFLENEIGVDLSLAVDWHLFENFLVVFVNQKVVAIIHPFEVEEHLNFID